MKESVASALTIGKEFAQRRSQTFDAEFKPKDELDRRLWVISFGEYQFNPSFDMKYKHWRELFEHCSEFIRTHAGGEYVPYKTEKDLMNWGKTQLEMRERKPVPKSWIACIYRLKALAEGQTR